MGKRLSNNQPVEAVNRWVEVEGRMDARAIIRKIGSFLKWIPSGMGGPSLNNDWVTFRRRRVEERVSK